LIYTDEDKRNENLLIIKGVLKHRELGQHFAVSNIIGRGGHRIHGGRGRGKESSRVFLWCQPRPSYIPRGTFDMYIPEEFQDTRKKSELRVTNFLQPHRTKPQKVEDTQSTESASGNSPPVGGLGWADVYSRLPPITGDGVLSPGPQDFGVVQESEKHAMGIYFHGNYEQYKEYKREVHVAFVGEQYPWGRFYPCEGDLILSPKRAEPYRSYIDCHEGDDPAIAGRRRPFTKGDLVLRIGHYNKVRYIISIHYLFFRS
jgi:hypothetical protein